MMGVCSLRILTGAIDLGRNYCTIRLSDKKAYSVSNEVTGTETFSIKAFTVDDKGAVTGEGALPSAIRYYLGSENCKDIKISSKTGTCYVNVALKKKQLSATAKIMGKVEPFIPLAAGVGMMIGACKLCNAFTDAAEENEVHFSLTAKKVDATKFSFDGELTLLEIGQRAAQAKAFAVADKSNAVVALNTIGAMLSGFAGMSYSGMSASAPNLNDTAELAGGLADFANSLVSPLPADLSRLMR